MKWRHASGALCDKKKPTKLKGKFYKVVVRQTLLYGAECCIVKNSHVQNICVAKMRMLRWMCEHTRSNKIKNEETDLLDYHMYKPLGPPCLVQMTLLVDNFLSFTIQRNKTGKRGEERKFQIFGRSRCSSLLGGQRMRNKEKVVESLSCILSYKTWKWLSY
uniref:Putative ovule protein n=1 Tax=Solanum chacoense TaxID=4108 RepID=A0A0V0HU30_SOLCH